MRVSALPAGALGLSCALLISLLAQPEPASAIVIGYQQADEVASLPESVMDAVGGQKWLFAHASVGANMVSGMESLAASDPVRYQLGFAIAGDGGQIYPPPPATLPGTVYDGPRGNPGWAAKLAIFDAAVRTLGWQAPVIDIAMNKLCYIDTDADAGAYLASMTALENDYPGTRFVYTTMPLQSGAGADGANILAGAYNEAVRLHCPGAGRLLLDIADIESHDPAGNAVTFTSGGHVYERLYSGYTSDGGHLNDLGARRVALGWYAAAAALAGGGTPVPEAAGPHALRITSIAPNPAPGTVTVRFELPQAGRLGLAVFDVRGNLVAPLVDGDVSAGGHVASWRGRDAGGRPAADGVYFVRLRGEQETSVGRIVLTR